LKRKGGKKIKRHRKRSKDYHLEGVKTLNQKALWGGAVLKKKRYAGERNV